VKVYGGFLGGEASIVSRDWESNSTILNGNIGDGGDIWDNSLCVVKFDHVGSTTHLDGFTIREGVGNDGGRIVIDGTGSGGTCSPVLQNLTVTANRAVEQAGGIFIHAADYGNASPSLSNCTIVGNHAELGGGMYFDIENSGRSTATLEDCKILSNVGYSHGGGIYMNGTYVFPTFDRCTISGNYANEGGGLYLNPGQYGYCRPIISNTLISGNRANYSGGGIYNKVCDRGEAEPSLYNCTFAGNRATYGGAINNWFTTDQTSSVGKSRFWSCAETRA